MIKEIFGECIYIGTVKEEKHKKIKELLLSEKNEKPFGSWGLCQVDSTFFTKEVLVNSNINSYDEILNEELITHMNNINSYIKFVVQNCWHNIYKKGDFQEPHHHINPDSTSLACIYCISESDAKLYFTNQNCLLQKMSNMNSVFKNENYKENYYPDLKEGTILIFPSYLYHGVSPQKTDSERITIACNLKVIFP